MTDREKWQLLCREMHNTYPVLSSVFTLADTRFGTEWVGDCIRNIETMYGHIDKTLPTEIVEALDGYAEFANDSMRNQVYFEKHGRYRASNYAEVSQQCYHNEEHMNRRYLPGMYISHYVWPQHYNMLRGFTHGILPRLKECKLFFEVGVGCGMYSRATLEALPACRGVGFDISTYSLEFTGHVMEAFGLSTRYTLENRDIQLGYHEQCDFMICQEVLEHLENPAEFCRWLFKMIRPGGHAYITAALNAAHSDHIFLFSEPNQLETMVREAGFQPLHSQEEFAAGFKPRAMTPSLCGYFCVRP